MTANTLISPSWLTRETLRLVSNNVVAAKMVDTHFVNEFKAVGETISIRDPVQYTVRTGLTRSQQAIIENSRTLTVGAGCGIDIEMQSRDLALTMERLSERYLQPAANRLANYLDADILSTACAAVPQYVGTAGTVPTATTALRDLMSKMDKMAIPSENRQFICEPTAWGNFMEVLKDKFTPSINEAALRSAGKLSGIYSFANAVMSQNLPIGTTGTETALPASLVVTDASIASGDSTIDLAGGGNAKTIAAGEILTFSGVYDVNPVSKVQLPDLKQFVVTETNTSSAGGAYTAVKISPAMISTGPYQNISALPVTAVSQVTRVSNTASTIYRNSIAFVKEAIALVVIPLPDQKGAAFCESLVDPDTGLSLRWIDDYDVTNDKGQTRVDLLYGTKLLRPQHAVRLLG